jgi:hypothetical protein
MRQGALHKLSREVSEFHGIGLLVNDHAGLDEFLLRRCWQDNSGFLHSIEKELTNSDKT